MQHFKRVYHMIQANIPFDKYELIKLHEMSAFGAKDLNEQGR